MFSFLAFSLLEAIARVQLVEGSTQGVKPLLALAFPFWVIVETFIFGSAALALVRRLEWHRQLQFAAFFTLIAPATARALRFVFSSGSAIVYASLLISLVLYLGVTCFKNSSFSRTSNLAVGIVGIQLFFVFLVFLSLHQSPLWLQFSSALTGYHISK